MSVPTLRATVPIITTGAAFLAMFDATVVNLAIPDLAGDHPSASIPDLTWIITLYVVLLAAVLAPAGRLADVVGCRTLYLAGTGLFTVSSLVCAVAPNLPVLFAARSLQGMGAAAMIPASLALLLRHTPPERQTRAVGLWGAAGAVAAAIGPSGGGLLVDLMSWRAIFFINLPLGLALIIGALAVPRIAGSGGRWPDLPGTVLLALGIGGLVLGLGQGQSWGWTDGATLGSVVGGAAAIAVSLHRSTRHPVPAVETTLWRSRRFAVANVASFLYGAALLPWLFIGVLFLTEVWHYSELEAGLAQSPGAVTAAVTALMCSRLIARFGPQAAVAGGALIMVLTVLWIHLGLTTEPHFLTFWLPTGLFVGIGMGALATGVASAAALSVEPVRFAGAIGLNTAARQVGGALGVAALAAILPRATTLVLDDYLHVYLFCGIVAFLAVLAGIGLTVRTPAAGTPVPEDSPI